MSARADICCLHCGTPFHQRTTDENFCCSGCHFVHSLIAREGFNRFYDLKGQRTLTPVKSQALQARDYQWLQDALDTAEEKTATSEAPHLDLDVQGISCVACVWLIENLFARHAGALRVDVNVQSGQLRLTWERGKLDPVGFAEELQSFGYVLGVLGDETNSRPETRELTLKLGLCAAFALNCMAFSLPKYLGMGSEFLFANVFQLVAALSATLSLLVGGGYFIRRAWFGIKCRTLHIDTPISLGIISAYLGSLCGWVLNVEGLLYFDFVAVFIFLMLLGRWVQQLAVEKNRNRLLGSASPLRPGMDQVVRGDEIELRAGEMLPVAGRLLEDRAEFSLETINGEAEPRTYGLGNEIPAGAIPINRRPVRLEAIESFPDSLVARLLADSSSQPYRSPTLERVLQWYLIAVTVTACIGAILWIPAGGATALQVFISILVVSCPCALGVSLPIVDEMASNHMRSLGLFIRRGDLWARLAGVGRIFFDKTGTLTMDTPELVNPQALEFVDHSMLAALVRDSHHPLSRALRERLFVAPAAGEVVEVPGCGLIFGQWSLGKPGWKCPDRADGIETHLCRGNQLISRFKFSEALREDAEDEIRKLQQSGKTIGILSGDQTERVKSLASALHLDRRDCLGDLTPDQKAEHVDGHTLYIGDGANDSLAFDAALCRGTPALGGGILEGKSDFYYLGRGLRALRALFEVARQRRRAMTVILVLATAYNVGAVSICLAGWMSPLLAAILMPLSSVATLAVAGILRPRQTTR